MKGRDGSLPSRPAMIGMLLTAALLAACSRGAPPAPAATSAAPGSGAVADTAARPEGGVGPADTAPQSELGRAAVDALHRPLDAAHAAEAAETGRTDAMRRQIDEASR
ncbi:hypothetical protein [Derxia gummosa]|uniref:Uncharacterized protein n=1 Tax=Derxia gummosa DSM 723 TaxID=1121388 RepID=A0A8B6X1U6_9BURK|nr:hypothetical protein [Derxia gummosa]